MSAYPEHEKLQKVSGQSQAIGEFGDWLMARGIQLGQYEEHPGLFSSSEWFVPVSLSITSLLAEYFEIDEGALEAEKRAMLDSLRASSAETDGPAGGQ